MKGFPSDYEFTNKRIDFEDINTLIKLHRNMMLDRCSKMFKWEGLPDGVPQKFLELYLQCNGFVGFADTEAGIRAFFGGLGGELNEYYMPTHFIVSNPWLQLSKDFNIHYEYSVSEFDRSTDAIVGYNDTLGYGLLPLINKYATQLATNEITLNVADINSRAINILTASSDMAKSSIVAFLKDLVKGKISHIRTSIIKDDDVRSLPFSQQTNNGITNLIELQQYYKASFYNEIGLNANYNMKRESIRTSEADMNHDALRPLIDDMLAQREELADRLNKYFNLNISVTFDSIWAQRVMQEEINELEEMERAADDGGLGGGLGGRNLGDGNGDKSLDDENTPDDSGDLAINPGDNLEEGGNEKSN